MKNEFIFKQQKGRKKEQEKKEKIGLTTKKYEFRLQLLICLLIFTS